LSVQAANTLQDAVRNVSGLSQAGNNYGIGDNLILRGLGVSYTYDGMYGGADLGNSFNPTRTLSNIESIEVLKGPATGLYGIGAAGGVINLVEKKPLATEQYEVKGVAGAWDTYGLMLDANG
ncbi:TonB-dependent receptor, partial [Pseudoalteromonas ruthenica]